MSETIERTYSWLNPAGADKPAWDVQDGTITSSGLTLTVEGVVSNIAAGSLIEWPDGEIALVRSASGVTVTLQERGYMETTAAAHSDGERILVRPAYTRKAIFNAIVSVIEDLPGYDMWRLQQETATTLSTLAPVALPANTKGIRSPMWVFNDTLQPDQYIEGIDFLTIFAYDPPKVQFLRGRHGASLLITLKKEFTVPTTEADDLTTTCFIPGPLARHVPMAAAGTLLQAKDVPRAAAEEIRRQMAGEGIPVGTGGAISRVMLSGWVDAIAREKSRQLQQYPTRISV